MKTVYKYPLSVAAEQWVPLPEGAAVLHVAKQDGQLFMWALVDPSVESVRPRLFSVIGTGQTVDDGMRHVGTAAYDVPTRLVWHVFEKETP